MCHFLLHYDSELIDLRNKQTAVSVEFFHRSALTSRVILPLLAIFLVLNETRESSCTRNVFGMIMTSLIDTFFSLRLRV